MSATRDDGDTYRLDVVDPDGDRITFEAFTRGGGLVVTVASQDDLESLVVRITREDRPALAAFLAETSGGAS